MLTNFINLQTHIFLFNNIVPIFEEHSMNLLLLKIQLEEALV
jgi:hypothetical protein